MIDRVQLATLAAWLGCGAACTAPTVGPTTYFLCPGGAGLCTADGGPALAGGSSSSSSVGGSSSSSGGSSSSGSSSSGSSSGESSEALDGGCVIPGNGTFPDLLFPRWALGGAYITFTGCPNGCNDERIFLAGGFDAGDIATSDVEFDEFDTGSTWGAVGSGGLSPRAYFPLVAQPSTGLYAIGGSDTQTHAVLGDMVMLSSRDAPSSSSYWYTQVNHFSDGGFAIIQMIQPRFEHAAVLEADGDTVIACGGNAGGASTSSCELFELSSLLDAGAAWRPGPSMRFERQGLEMAVGSDGYVYAFSGSGNDTRSLTNWERLDPNDPDGGWSCPGTCPSLTSGHVNGAAVAIGSSIYVMGGLAAPDDTTSLNALEALNVSALSDGWTQESGMLIGRSAFAAVALPTGNLRVFGGAGGPYSSCTVAGVEEYSPSSNEWQ